MKPSIKYYEKNAALTISGGLIIILVFIQNAYSIELSIFTYCIGINLLLKEIIGWCLMEALLKKIERLQNK